MRKLTILTSAALLMMSGVAFANGAYSTAAKTAQMTGQVVASKDKAYQEGQQMLSDLKSKSSYELSQALPTRMDPINRRSFQITNSEVTVKESMNNGQIAYQPIVNVSYEYDYRDGKY
ncbi:DUF3316 domain-containing protein [Vibrio sp. V39_P1S14PM300]|uniref:DUF3316 domain-containing protein n=2 Tax=Vibrio TaxID=662 RepID=UPI0013734C41|nr:DUF3316 domain-containing protein [Vibrio sp. V39_P1S14PM300]NAX22052.1 DUF3316 domain-containing protein [Vibrio sp. V39_P1S14PM300]